jgi:hypothetical protein
MLFLRLMANAATRACGHRVAALAAAIVVAVSLSAVTARSAEAGRAVVLGAAKPVAASCPENCLVEARVTGFQMQIGRHKNPFTVRRNGRIVAWSVKLGTPGKTDLQYFNERFGRSRARISVLKPVRVRRKGKPAKVRYKLLRQGPLQDLQPFFGETTSFGLPNSLTVRKGNVVALTIPTWAPAFATVEATRWRASRAPSKKRGDCVVERGQANVEAGSAHEDPGTMRRYGCSYRGARLLYTARQIVDPEDRAERR